MSAKKRKVVAKISQDGTVVKNPTTDTKKRKVVAKVNLDNSVTKYNNSNLSIPHAQQYNLDGSKKIAPTVSITTNNIAKQGSTNLINNTLQQDIKNKTFQAATGQNKQQINLVGDSTLTKSQKQELREKTAEERKKINENLPQMVSADSVKNKNDDLVKDLSKKTGYSEQEVTNFIDDYNNGRWDSTKPKYRNASYKFKEAGTEVYLAAKEYDKYKPTLNKQLSPLENASQSSVNALIETGKGVVDFSEGVLDAGVQLGSSKYNPMMWITTGQTPWSKDQSKLDNYQDIAKEIVSKDASQNFIDNELGYGKTLSNGRTIQETLDEGALIKSDNLGGQVFRNIGAQLPGLMTGSETGSLASMGISSFGSGVEQAYNQGATRGEATGYGLLNSGIEIATEKIFSGVGGVLGKGELDDAIINGINKNIKNQLAQKLTSFGIKSLGEGTEEFIGDLLQPIAQKLTYASEEELMKLWKDQNYLEDFVSGVLSAAIMQGSTMPINNQNQIQIKNQVKEIINKDNANQIFNDIVKNNKNLSEWEVANIVNNALKETNQKPVDFSKNVVQNETTQETNSNTPQISQEIEQNQELSNETINNSQNTQYSQIENNKKKIAPVIIKYEKSDNQKINNYRQSAIREGLYDNEKTRSLMNVSEKLIQEKGYNIVFDRTITNEKGQPVNAQIKPLDNGEIEIRVNPNSERAGEFLLIHEVSHAIKTQDMIDYVNKFASKNKTFAESVKSLEQQYGKDLTNEEVFADVCGQLFGNQEFIDSLVVENTPQSKNIIKKVYESIKRLLNNFTTEGRYKKFVQELETKWREAYKNTSTKQAISNLNNETKYAQKTLKDGTQYIETEKNLFTKDDGTAMSQREIYNSLIGKKITFNDGITATIKQWLPNNKNMYNELFKRYPNYKNVNDIKGVNKNINENIVELLENSNNVSSNEPDYMNRHKDNKINSFDTRKVSFFDGKNAYDLDFSIAKMQDGNYVAYAKKNLSANNELLNKIKKEAPTSKSRGVLPYADNISQNRNNVKSYISSTKYSMQESTNNTQELDNSSFSLKQKQLDIILKNNPVQDDYHTWIRTVDDIKTLEETIADSDWADYDEFNPDLTKQDIEDAINSGKIMVYSSYPIGQGIFVSPSRMEAESYSSDGKVYSKEVNIDDVAWIDPTQGQYAKVQEKIAKNNLNVDNQGRTLTKEQYEYFKDSKVRDKKGKLEVMYRGDTGETINVFDKNKSKKSNLYGTGFYFSDESMASLYGNTTPYYLNIVNPLYVNKDTHNITKEQYSNFIKLAIENEDYSFENYGNMSTDELINKLYDGRSDFKLINDVVATAMGDYRDAFDVFEKANGIKYDGIISNSQTVVFDSNQIKNVDNTNPTSNADIRYSQENQTWQEHLEENYKATGTRTYFNEITDSNKKTLAPIHKETKKVIAPIVRENNEINKSRNTNRLIAKEQNTDNVKKKIIKAKVKTKKNNNGLKSARTAAKIAQNKMDLSNNEKNEFRKELMKYKGYTREKLTNARTYNEIKDIVKKYSDREISYANREIQDIKDYIRNTKLEVTQELKNSITDYNDFRKSNFGKLKLSNEGMSIDSLYEELSQTYPGYFSNEIDTDEDRLYAIADFMNEDSIITEKYSLDDKTIDDITAKVFNTLQENAFSKDQIEQFEKEISDRMSKITRKSVREMLQKQMGITAEDLSIGKDIKSPNYQITDPIRVNEKVFGRELGDKINNETIRKTTHNEARKIRWLNSERNDIKELGIKPRSKESAAVQKYGEKQYLNKNGELVKYGDKELRAEFPNEKTQEKIKRAAEVIRNKYDKYIDEINQTLTSLGYDAIPKRADYMRHFQELGDIFSKTGVPFNLNDMRAEDLPTDINGLTEFNRPGKNYFASSQKRIGQKTTYDAITGIDGYLEGAGNLIYHTADIQRYRALSSLIRDSFGSSKGFDNLGNLTDAQAEQRVNDILDNKLSRYAAWLDEQANNLVGKKGAIDRGVERFLGRRVYTGLNTIKKQVGSNMTGFNVRSAMTNLISSTIASAKTNKIALIKGTVSTINNMFKNDGFIEKSDFLTTRFGSNQLSKKLWQKASNAGQIFMTGTDYFTANQITRSKYYEGLQKGMSESEAIKYADDFASRVMGDRSLGRTAEMFNSKTLGLLTQFQLEVNNQWQYMIHDTKMDYQENSEINGGLKAGATALFQMGQLAAFSYLFNELFETLTGSRAAFDPIEILKKLFEDDDKPWDERISAANKELVDNIPFGNLLTGGGRIPISEAFKGISTFGKKITGQKNQYGGDITWEDVKTDVLETLPYYVLPTGYSQAKKTIKGLSMFSKDKETTGSYTKGGDLRFPVKDTTSNKIQAGLFGEYSSKNAREYFDNGYSAMGTNQQKMYKTLNIPISDYWKIRKEINSIKSELKGTDKSTEERKKIFYEYIDSLDVSNIKKSILKKSIYKSYDEADGEIKEYINSSKMSKQSKKDLLKELGLDD